MAERVTIAGLSALIERPPTETAAPLLFVHGFFGRAFAFERMMVWFARRGHLCVAIDLRGHGDSRPDVALGTIGMRDYADDVVAVSRALGEPVLVGHSMGGLLVQMASARGHGRGVVLLATAPPRPIPVMSLRLAIAQIRYMPSILRSRVVTPGRKDLLTLVLNRVPAAEQEAVLSMLVPDSGQAAKEMSVFGVQVDRTKVRTPVLCIAGDDDRFIPLARQRRVARRYGAPLRVAPGRGHMLVIEPGYEELCSWIAHWAETCVPATPALAVR